MFVAGLLVALSYGIHPLLATLTTCTPCMPRRWLPLATDAAKSRPGSVARTCGYACLRPALRVLFFSWRVDVNVFSFHMFYRNRLVALLSRRQQ